MTSDRTQTGLEPATSASDAEATRGIQLVVGGSVLAILGPLAGFLIGSMIGPSRHMGDYDALFVSLFVGLVVGGLGAVIAFLGAQRWFRSTRPG